MEEEYELLQRRVLKGSTTILFFTFLVSPVAYLIRVLYSRTLSVEQYGLFYAVAGLFALLITYNDLGFGYSLSYLIPKFLKQKDYQKTWNLYKYEQIIEVGTSTFLSLILIILAKWLASSYFRTPGVENLIYIFAVYFITNSLLEAIKKFFQGLQEESYYSSIQFFKQLLILIFSSLFWLFNIQKIIYFAICWSLANLVIFLVYNFLLYRKNEFIVKTLCWDKKLLKLMSKYAFPSLISYSIYSFTVYSDTLLLTLFKDVRAVGIYNIVVPLASISALFLSPLNRLILPLTSHIMEGEKDKLRQLLKIILRVSPLIALYFALFIFIFPTAPVVLLFGDKWRGLVEIPLIILAFGYIPSVLANYLATIISGAGLVKEMVRSSVIITFVSIIVSFSFIPKFGIIGAVLSNSFVYFFSVIIFSKVLKSILSFSFPFGYYAKLLILSLLIYFPSKLINPNPIGWVQFIVAGVVYTILFICFGYFLKLFDRPIISLIFKKDYVK